MLTGADSTKKWGDIDIRLMQAYQIIQDETCSQCGFPLWLCQNEDLQLMARAKEVECMGKATLDDATEAWHENKSNKDKRAPALRVEFYSRDGRPLHAFRKPYYEARHAQVAEEAKE